MNLPRWLVILIIVAIAWFILRMAGFTSKKVSEFNKRVYEIEDNIESAE